MGGLGGHMAHLSEDLDLTFNEILDGKTECKFVLFNKFLYFSKYIPTKFIIIP